MVYLSLQFIKANPSGNTTILVLTPLPRAQYAPVTQLLMQETVLAAEQVGFVEKTAAGSRLQMMGGEFCGNASRSYAAWLMMGGRAYLLAPGDVAVLQPLQQAHSRLQVEVSGHSGPLTARIEEIGSAYGCFAEIDMPQPQSIHHGQHSALGPYSLVGFAGIVHGVLWGKAADEALLPVFRRLLQQQGLPDTDCGIMFVEQQEPLFIRPLVHIGGVGSLVWEQSCGSGSLATLCALADLKQQSYHRLRIDQPGGPLQLSGEYSEQGIRHTRLAGSVYFTAHGLAHIEL